MKVLFEELLADWCDGLLKLQVARPGFPGLDGGLLCPACARIHGRCMDAVYPLMHMAARTGREEYLDAAVRLEAWSDNVSCPDGSYHNEIGIALWKGITVFAAIAMAEALTHHGHLLDTGTRERWTDRLRRAGAYLYDHVEFGRWNVNYPITCSYAMALLGNWLDEPRFTDRGHELAHRSLDCLTHPNRLLYGEGSTGSTVSRRGCQPVDLGYNVEESLPALVLYGLTAGDMEVLDGAAESLASHLEFMLPDGAWDNSWGTRNYKWTYWGSRTADGCQPAYALLAERNPAFAQAARRNAQLLRACTHDGLLHGGPHYASHGVPPCVHHTFCHAKAMASVLDCRASAAGGMPAPLPRQVAEGVHEFPEILTWLAATGPWRGTITAYDWDYAASGHASGGALSMLWHQTLGPVLTASLTEYVMAEPSNMQANRDRVSMSLTPRLEAICANTRYTNLHDHDADVSYIRNGSEIAFSVSASLLDNDHKPPSAGTLSCRIGYCFTPRDIAILTRLGHTGHHGSLRFVLPVISASNERMERLSETSVRISKPGGSLTVSANSPLAVLDCDGQRVFNHVPGFEAIPLSADWDPDDIPTLRIHITPGPEHPP